MKVMLNLAFVAIGVLVMNQSATAADAVKTDGAKTQAEAKPLDLEMKTLEGKKVNLAEK